eukprot:TRINITY_DN15484_c0_g1_i1.p1 TRINITY_DN15484_c0_g1~~TRINITY_DN15484_c0_g1_i1.p1  ORF type:complete len:384 (-),score=79.88 TRINITY_DN15484_c0_g1_i1:71-1222(-)
MSKTESIERLLSLNEESLNLWKEIQKSIPNNDNIMEYNMLSKVIVRRDVIMLEASLHKYEISPINQYFTNLDNIFNDTLPDKEYFDLSSRIKKYHVLMDEAVLPILSEWEKVINNVKEYYLSVQKKISEDTGFIQKVRRLLEIPNDEFSVILEMNENKFEPSVLDFDFQCDSSNEMEKIVNLKNFLYSFYRPIEFRSKDKNYFFLESSILIDFNERIMMENWLMILNVPKKKSELLYRGSKNGFSSTNFHSICNNKPNTITFIRSNNFIFGGYTPISWTSAGGYKCDTGSFIFSLSNPSNMPILFKILKPQFSIDDSSNYGPTFGGGNDIYISDNCNSNSNSYSNLGHSYSGCPHKFESVEAKTFLCGSYKFRVDEIEVYQLL